MGEGEGHKEQGTGIQIVHGGFTWNSTFMD